MKNKSKKGQRFITMMICPKNMGEKTVKIGYRKLIVETETWKWNNLKDKLIKVEGNAKNKDRPKN